MVVGRQPHQHRKCLLVSFCAPGVPIPGPLGLFTTCFAHALCAVLSIQPGVPGRQHTAHSVYSTDSSDKKWLDHEWIAACCALDVNVGVRNHRHPHPGHRSPPPPPRGQAPAKPTVAPQSRAWTPDSYDCSTMWCLDKPVLGACTHAKQKEDTAMVQHPSTSPSQVTILLDIHAHKLPPPLTHKWVEIIPLHKHHMVVQP